MHWMQGRRFAEKFACDIRGPPDAIEIRLARTRRTVRKRARLCERASIDETSPVAAATQVAAAFLD